VDHITFSKLQISRMEIVLLHMGKCYCKRCIFTCEKDHIPKFEVQKLRIIHNIGPPQDTLRRSTAVFIKVQTISHQSL
jgi:hypothetical protein